MQNSVYFPLVVVWLSYLLPPHSVLMIYWGEGGALLSNYHHCRPPPIVLCSLCFYCISRCCTLSGSNRVGIFRSRETQPIRSKKVEQVFWNVWLNIARITKKLHREHLIGYQGVKLFLLKYVAITTVTTATITTVTVITLTIWVLELSQFDFWVLSLFGFLSQFGFLRCHIFLVLSQFEFLSLVTIWVFEFCHN